MGDITSATSSSSADENGFWPSSLCWRCVSEISCRITPVGDADIGLGGTSRDIAVSLFAGLCWSNSAPSLRASDSSGSRGREYALDRRSAGV